MQTNQRFFSNFSERLLYFIQESGSTNPNTLSQKLGYKHSEKINRLIRNPLNKPSYDILRDIALHFPNCNMNWLITGKGNLWDNVESPSQDPQDYIPLYDVVASAGNSTAFWEKQENIIDYIPRKFGMRDCHLAIHVHGESMYPTFMPGDVIVLKEMFDYQLINYGEVYVIITEEQRLLKYLQRSEREDYLLLQSENSRYQHIEVHKSKIIKLFQVQGFFRKISL